MQNDVQSGGAVSTSPSTEREKSFSALIFKCNYERGFYEIIISLEPITVQ